MQTVIQMFSGGPRQELAEKVRTEDEEDERKRARVSAARRIQAARLEAIVKEWQNRDP